MKYKNLQREFIQREISVLQTQLSIISSQAKAQNELFENEAKKIFERISLLQKEGQELAEQMEEAALPEINKLETKEKHHCSALSFGEKHKAIIEEGILHVVRINDDALIRFKVSYCPFCGQRF